MPFKSKAQRRHFAKKLAAGEITQKTFDEFQKDTPTDIPERVTNSLKVGKVKVINKNKVRKR